MNVKELKEKLNEFPDDAIIVVRGYEYGYWEAKPENIEKVEVALDVNDTRYGGPHDIVEEWNKDTFEKNTIIVNGVHISGENIND